MQKEYKELAEATSELCVKYSKNEDAFKLTQNLKHSISEKRKLSVLSKHKRTVRELELSYERTKQASIKAGFKY